MTYTRHLSLVEDVDPRDEFAAEAPPADPANDLRPAVAGERSGRGPWLLIGVAVLLAVAVLFWLTLRRTSDSGDEALPPPAPASAAASSAAPQLPPDLAIAEAAGRPMVPAPGLQPTPSAIPMTSTTPIAASVAGYASSPAYGPLPTYVPAPSATPGPAAAPDRLARRRAPVLIVDLAAPASAAAGLAAAPAVGQAAASPAGQPGGALADTAASLAVLGALGPMAAGAQGGAGGLSDDERFAERVGSAEAERARAVMLRNPQWVVPQGATITAVLETALNSDLPGFARAVVSRDVRSFDGKTVLIPRGSRLIGQYRSGVAVGQSRAFVIWSRVLRPDGASVQIASSGADPLGRAGLEGRVDRHFFRRFGGSTLLSVIGSGFSALTNRPSTQIVIGSSQQAAGLAAGAAPREVSPTIRVAQGTPISIFVARDLDFSGVQGATR